MPSEADAWEKIRAGDPEPFGVVFDQHHNRVYGQALRLTGTTHDAEDVVGLVFLEAWRKRSTVRLVDGSALAWLLVTTNFVAANAARSVRRHRVAMAKMPPPENEPDPSDAVLSRFDRSAAHTRLRAAFGSLSRADQDVLTLCVVNEFSLAEAAVALHVPVGTVKSRLSRAKQRLAHLTGAPLSDDPSAPDSSSPVLGDLR